MLNVSITRPHFNLLNQHKKQTKNPDVSTKITHFRSTFDTLPVWAKFWTLVSRYPGHMSVECKWFYNFHHSTSSVINPTVKPSKSTETHFRFEINSEIWFQGTLYVECTCYHPHFNLLNQHKKPKNPYFPTKKLPTSGLLLTHFRFGVNSEIWFPGTLDIYLTNASGFIIFLIQLLHLPSQT